MGLKLRFSSNERKISDQPPADNQIELNTMKSAVHPNTKRRSGDVTFHPYRAVWVAIRNKSKLVLLIFLGLCIAACAGLSNPKPTDEEIIQAIMTRGAWNPLVGRIELETVEIDTRGYFNAEKKYWPVKAKITTKKTRQIAVLDFQIFKDDYGKWSARPAERQ